MKDYAFIKTHYSINLSSSSDVDNFIHILSLAKQKLDESDKVQLLSLPMYRQAGLLSPTVLRVESMIDQMLGELK